MLQLQSPIRVHEWSPHIRSRCARPLLRLPLRLQTRTRHGVLFAFNARHLDWIEAFVAAGLRERRRGDGMANRSIASRLPASVKAGKNREAVLRAIGRLRRRLVELTQPR